MNGQERLDGKIALITGGGRGIGRATAHILARAGAHVIVIARTQSQVEETIEQICANGGEATAYTTDVADWSAVQHTAQAIIQTHGRAPDIIVANAGIITPVGDTWEILPEEWLHNLTVNLGGAFHIARAFLPKMIARQQGILIFVSSGAAVTPVPGWSAYCAAKAGLDHFTRTLAAELRQREIPIRVHTLYPGIVATAMQAQIRQTSEEQFPLVNTFRSYHERGQLRSPDEPATLIWWLCTPMAADLHGQIVDIDDPQIRQRIKADLPLPPS